MACLFGIVHLTPVKDKSAVVAVVGCCDGYNAVNDEVHHDVTLLVSIDGLSIPCCRTKTTGWWYYTGGGQRQKDLPPSILHDFFQSQGVFKEKSKSCGQS
jgi:hypothetical protein